MSVFVKQRGVSAARRPPRAALTRGSPRAAPRPRSAHPGPAQPSPAPLRARLRAPLSAHCPCILARAGFRYFSGFVPPAEPDACCPPPLWGAQPSASCLTPVSRPRSFPSARLFPSRTRGVRCAEQGEGESAHTCFATGTPTFKPCVFPSHPRVSFCY